MSPAMPAVLLNFMLLVLKGNAGFKCNRTTAMITCPFSYQQPTTRMLVSGLHVAAAAAAQWAPVCPEMPRHARYSNPCHCATTELDIAAAYALHQLQTDDANASSAACSHSNYLTPLLAD
jgi:hypothetical protein